MLQLINLLLIIVKSSMKKVIDSPEVYYQSYISVMKDCLSDILLTIPYFFIKILEGENDWTGKHFIS